MQTAFITSKRDHLFDMTYRLMGFIEPESFYDPCKPVIISVRGSKSSGKKIIADASRQLLFDNVDMAVLKGKKDYDEFWHGYHDNIPIELDYMDAAYRGGYSQNYSHSDREDLIVRGFLRKREKGGLTFVQNCAALSNDQMYESKPSINIFIADGNIGWECTTEESKFPEGPLFRQKFNELSGNNRWLRHVWIQVHDNRFLKSERFHEGFNTFMPDENVGLRSSATHVYEKGNLWRRFYDQYICRCLLKETSELEHIIPVYGSTVPVMRPEGLSFPVRFPAEHVCT